MSKKDLIDAVAKDAELTKEKASVAVDAVLEHIRGAMRKGEEVRIPDFGTFKVAKRKAREGRNPATGATINIPASRAFCLAGSEAQPRCAAPSGPLHPARGG